MSTVGLTSDELRFLNHHRLVPEDVFDARGMPKWEWA